MEFIQFISWNNELKNKLTECKIELTCFPPVMPFKKTIK